MIIAVVRHSKIGASYVGSGSWLCENAKTLDGDRRSYSSKTALTVKRASELNLTNEPKNVILAAFQSFAFLHSQGSKGDLADPSGVSPRYPRNLTSGHSPRMSATGHKRSVSASNQAERALGAMWLGAVGLGRGLSAYTATIEPKIT